MTKSVNYITICLIALSSFLFTLSGNAQEYKNAGDCLEQPAWVFTEAEFDTLLITWQASIEKDSLNMEIIALQDSLLKEYKELDENKKLGFFRWPTVSEWVLLSLAVLGWVSK